MERTRNHKGITLIALTITIIVLLILAGVGINMAINSNGLFEKANQAVTEWNKDAKKEEEDITNLLTNVENMEKRKKAMEEAASSVENIVFEGVTIPAGYAPTKIEGESKVNEGLVIIDAKGNEFVWVPVEKPEEMYGTDEEGNYLGKLYYFSKGSEPTPNGWEEENNIMKWKGDAWGKEPDILPNLDGKYLDVLNLKSTDEFKLQLQNDFKEMVESVKKYKGFFIGRYETGNLEANTNTVPIVQKGNTKISNVNWYYMYQNSKKIANNPAVATTMIWGSQYDAVMKWFLKCEGDIASYVTDSTGKANYKGTQGEDKIIPTGSKEEYKVNNIYDLAGNVWEYTIEVIKANKELHHLRGGGYASPSTNNCASIKGSNINIPPDKADEAYGTRVALYIKGDE